MGGGKGNEVEMAFAVRVEGNGQAGVLQSRAELAALSQSQSGSTLGVRVVRASSTQVMALCVADWCWSRYSAIR